MGRPRVLRPQLRRDSLGGNDAAEVSMIRGFSFLLLLTAGTTTLASQRPASSDSSPVVITSGVGQISLRPDRAVLNVTIETRDSTASAAAIKNTTRLRRVMDSLTAIRLPDESVQVVAVSVGPREDYQRAALVGYEASATVRFALRTLDRVGAIIDIALRTGATSIADVAFLSDREGEARAEALTRAYREAHNDAVALAKAAGMELGPILSLSTGVDPSRTFRVYAEAAAASFGSVETEVSPRDIRVTATVTGTWRLSGVHR